MIVTCPSCQNKYYVQPEIIGNGKLVRCAACLATWQQPAIGDGAKFGVGHAVRWTFFWLFVFSFVFSLIFAKNFVLKIWPPAIELYDIFDAKHANSKNCFVIKNISNFFVQKDGKLYMGLKGELTNISNDVQFLPSITISLKDDYSASEKANASCYTKVWTHKMMYKKLLPNQKVIFETELQNVPYNDLVCDIKLNT
jgi:predicted Zn finger-like uncharacterized protein